MSSRYDCRFVFGFAIDPDLLSERVVEVPVGQAGHCARGRRARSTGFWKFFGGKGSRRAAEAAVVGGEANPFLLCGCLYSAALSASLRLCGCLPRETLKAYAAA